MVKPKVLLITGDLVHATGADNRKNEQYTLEWTIYRETILESGVLDNVKVLDLLGNHDSFNSVSGEAGSLQENAISDKNEMVFDENEVGSSLKFVPVQLASFPGIGKPFNFIGHVQNENLVFSSKNEQQNEQKNEQKYSENTTENSSNMTFYYGHYPTSTISGAYSLRSLFREQATAYFSGHLHNGYGWLPEMKVLNRRVSQGAYLEAELADWKDHRIFRVCVVDNGVFSYRDFGFWDEETSLIVQTHPKWTVKIPGKEPVFTENLMEIRFFLFDLDEIGIVELKSGEIETSGEKHTSCNFKNLPLVTCPVLEKTESYQVYVNNKQIKNTTLRGLSTYSKSEVQDSSGPFIRLILLVYYELITPCLYYALILSGYFYLSYLHIIFPSLTFSRLFKNSKLASAVKLWLFVGMFGPWYFDRLSGEYYGLVFPWGIFLKVDGGIVFRWEPSLYFSGFKQLIGFWFPFVVMAPFGIDSAWKNGRWTGKSKFLMIFVYSSFAFYQFYAAYKFTKYYTILSFVSPYTTGAAILIVYFIHACNTDGSFRLTRV